MPFSQKTYVYGKIAKFETINRDKFKFYWERIEWSMDSRVNILKSKKRIFIINTSN